MPIPKTPKSPKVHSPRLKLNSSGKRRESFFDVYAEKAVKESRVKDGDLAAAVGLMGKVGDLSQELVGLRKAEKEKSKERDVAKKESTSLKRQVKELKRERLNVGKMQLVLEEAGSRATVQWAHGQALLMLHTIFEATLPIPAAYYTAVHAVVEEESKIRMGIAVDQAEYWKDMLSLVPTVRPMDAMAADHKLAAQVASLRSSLAKLEISEIEKAREIRTLRTQLDGTPQVTPQGSPGITSPVSSQAMTPESTELVTPPQHLITTYLSPSDRLHFMARNAGIAQARALVRGQA